MYPVIPIKAQLSVLPEWMSSPTQPGRRLGIIVGALAERTMLKIASRYNWMAKGVEREEQSAAD
jgi:hypothetical protein